MRRIASKLYAKKNLHARRHGFTLVELLVVIAVIGTLATLLLIQLGTARQKARDAKRVTDTNQVRTALEQYFDDNGKYPAVTDLNASLVPTYLILLPKDPLTTSCTTNYNGNGCYGYAYKPAIDPTGFHIWAELERKNQQAMGADFDINSAAGGWSGTTQNGTLETCPDTLLTTINCVYDVGNP